MKLCRILVMFKRHRYVPTKAERHIQSCLRKTSEKTNADGLELVDKNRRRC